MTDKTGRCTRAITGAPAGESGAEPQEQKVEHAGSQFVFGGANGALRLLRVVWAGGCEPAFLACGRKGHLDPALVRHRFGDRPGVPALLAAGSAAFFGPYVVHRSAENRGTRPCRIAINGFALPGANTRPYFGAGTGVPCELFSGA